MYSAAYNRITIARWLLEAGANPDLQLTSGPDEGHDALWFAEEDDVPRPEIANLIRACIEKRNTTGNQPANKIETEKCQNKLKSRCKLFIRQAIIQKQLQPLNVDKEKLRQELQNQNRQQFLAQAFQRYGMENTMPAYQKSYEVNLSGDTIDYNALATTAQQPFVKLLEECANNLVIEEYDNIPKKKLIGASYQKTFCRWKGSITIPSVPNLKLTILFEYTGKFFDRWNETHFEKALYILSPLPETESKEDKRECIWLDSNGMRFQNEYSIKFIEDMLLKPHNLPIDAMLLFGLFKSLGNAYEECIVASLPGDKASRIPLEDASNKISLDKSIESMESERLNLLTNQIVQLCQKNDTTKITADQLKILVPLFLD